MKTCTKCCRTLSLDAFHMELRRGKRVHKSRCAQCVQGEWANYQARQKGLMPPSEMAKAFNEWHGPAEPNPAWRIAA